MNTEKEGPKAPKVGRPRKRPSVANPVGETFNRQMEYSSFLVEHCLPPVRKKLESEGVSADWLDRNLRFLVEYHLNACADTDKPVDAHAALRFASIFTEDQDLFLKALTAINDHEPFPTPRQRVIEFLRMNPSQWKLRADEILANLKRLDATGPKVFEGATLKTVEHAFETFKKVQQ